MGPPLQKHQTGMSKQSSPSLLRTVITAEQCGHWWNVFLLVNTAKKCCRPFLKNKVETVAIDVFQRKEFFLYPIEKNLLQENRTNTR